MQKYIETRIHAKIDEETILELQQKYKLTEKAAGFLRYFEEVELEIVFESDTGIVRSAKVVGDYSDEEDG